MTQRQKVRLFDEKIEALEEERNSGIGGVNMGLILTNIFSFFLMIIPIRPLVEALGVFWIFFQGALLYCGTYFRLQWLLGLGVGGKQVSWLAFLKYIPVDRKEYQRHRYEILLKYTGKVFLCFAVLQLISQLLCGSLLRTGYHWQGLAYVTVMCFCFVLVPGAVSIRAAFRTVIKRKIRI